MNLTSKPNPGSGGVTKLKALVTESFARIGDGHSLDNLSNHRWLLEDHTDKENYLIFDRQNGNWYLKRQWAELAGWFPAVSRAAGWQPVEKLGGRNCNFTPFSGGVFGETHSYLKLTELHKVYKPWVTIKDIFAGNGCQ